VLDAGTALAVDAAAAPVAAPAAPAAAVLDAAPEAGLEPAVPPPAADSAGAADDVSMVTVLDSVPSGWVAAGTGAAWSESYAAAGATARIRDVSTGAACALSACCAGVSGSGMLPSTRCAAGDGVVLSIAAVAGDVDGAVPGEVE
jgi:hypothetical protein